MTNTKSNIKIKIQEFMTNVHNYRKKRKRSFEIEKEEIKAGKLPYPITVLAIAIFITVTLMIITAIFGNLAENYWYLAIIIIQTIILLVQILVYNILYDTFELYDIFYLHHHCNCKIDLKLLWLRMYRLT